MHFHPDNQTTETDMDSNNPHQPSYPAKRKGSESSESDSIEEDYVPPIDDNDGAPFAGISDDSVDLSAREPVPEQNMSSDNDDQSYAPVLSNGETVQSSARGSRKRKYTMSSRVASVCRKSMRRETWMGDAMRLIDEIDDTFCCKKLQCFKQSNQGYLSGRIKDYLSMSSESRKTVLRSMLSSQNFFSFDGKRVCSTFLHKAFKFTRAMQHAVKQSTQTSIPREDSSYEQISSRMEGSDSASNCDQFDDKMSPSRDSIVSFLEGLAESTADRMPDRSECHLPFFRKHLVYGLIVKEYNVLYPCS